MASSSVEKVVMSLMWVVVGIGTHGENVCPEEPGIPPFDSDGITLTAFPVLDLGTLPGLPHMAFGGRGGPGDGFCYVAEPLRLPIVVCQEGPYSGRPLLRCKLRILRTVTLQNSH